MGIIWRFVKGILKMRCEVPTIGWMIANEDS